MESMLKPWIFPAIILNVSCTFVFSSLSQLMLFSGVWGYVGWRGQKFSDQSIIVVCRLGVRLGFGVVLLDCLEVLLFIELKTASQVPGDT